MNYKYIIFVINGAHNAKTKQQINFLLMRYDCAVNNNKYKRYYRRTIYVCVCVCCAIYSYEYYSLCLLKMSINDTFFKGVSGRRNRIS